VTLKLTALNDKPTSLRLNLFIIHHHSALTALRMFTSCSLCQPSGATTFSVMQKQRVYYEW